MKLRHIVLLLMMFFLITACTGGSPSLSYSESGEQTSLPSFSPNATQEAKPTRTPTPTLTQTASPTATKTVLPPTITPTPWELSSFDSSLLNHGVEPVSYIEDTCMYLENRWGEGKSEPGTIVVPIMFHSLLKLGREVTDSSQITKEYFEYFVRKAEEMGFETITVAELAGFLERNEAIPQRSMIMILDDQRPGTVEYMLPFLEEHDWTLTLGWITMDATRESTWETMESLAETGRLDIQSHGHNHIYIQDYTPVDEIEIEIYKPIEVIKEHFSTTPTTLVWPGGNFTLFAVEMAREAGFELGFTAYSRGPLMFNWIPLGEAELAVGDPLMVLPRYWSVEAHLALEEAVAIGEAARAAAEEVREEELLFYSLFCQLAQGN